MDRDQRTDYVGGLEHSMQQLYVLRCFVSNLHECDFVTRQSLIDSVDVIIFGLNMAITVFQEFYQNES
jgi:hypothetical protein